MTSRNSFSNMLKEDFKRRLWTFILASLVFFGTFPVVFTMMLQGWVSNYTGRTDVTTDWINTRITGNITEFLAMNPWLMIVACVGAVICGVNGFAYLHSKKQMDFYHSLPVKRETLFIVRFVNGILIYAVPYLVSVLYAYLISAVFGVMNKQVFLAGIHGFFWNLMGYTIMYLVTIIAMILTGKLVIAFFGIAVLNAYAPAVYGLSMLLRESFFITSYAGSVDWEDTVAATRWLSPFSYYFKLISNVYDGYGGATTKEALAHYTKTACLEVLAFIVAAAALTAVALWLYKKRPSEKAGMSMSFKVSEPVIRIMIAIPVGILAGLLLFVIQYDYAQKFSLVWLVFGAILGAFLAHGIIESLYQGDVKKCLSHKVQMAGTVVAAVIVPLLFYFDVFGFDSYIPKKNEIAHVAVISDAARFGGSYRDEDGNYISAVNFAMEEMQITELDAAYGLAEFLVEKAGENRTDKFFGYQRIGSYASDAKEINVTNFIIQYTLKNGDVVTRSYEYNMFEVMDKLEQLYADMEYRTAIHPLFSLEIAEWQPTKIISYSPVYPIQGEIKNKQVINEILTAYRRELLSLSFDELMSTAAIGELEIYYDVYNDAGETTNYNDNVTFLIYPSMAVTRTLLEENGCHMRAIEEVDYVDTITVRYYGSLYELLGEEEAEKTVINFNPNSVDSYGYEYGYYEEVVTQEYRPAMVYDYKEIKIEITDEKEIAECIELLNPSNYYSEFGPFPQSQGYFDVEVYFELESALDSSGLIAWEEQFRFEKDSVPDYVMERMIEKLTENQGE